jgi:hypothetical protein
MTAYAIKFRQNKTQRNRKTKTRFGRFRLIQINKKSGGKKCRNY